MTNLDSIEAALLDSCEKARAKGLDIVYGKYIEGPAERPTGCCALGAHRYVHKIGRLIQREAFGIDSNQEVSLGEGFDAAGNFGGQDPVFYNLGLRLREKLNPRPARV